MQQLVEEGFHCAFLKPALSVKGWMRCREKQEPLPRVVLERALALDSYAIHSAVQVVARALHAASSSRPRRRLTDPEDTLKVPRVHSWQVPHLQHNIHMLL